VLFVGKLKRTLISLPGTLTAFRFPPRNATYYAPGKTLFFCPEAVTGLGASTDDGAATTLDDSPARSRGRFIGKRINSGASATPKAGHESAEENATVRRLEK